MNMTQTKDYKTNLDKMQLSAKTFKQTIMLASYITNSVTSIIRNCILISQFIFYTIILSGDHSPILIMMSCP